MEIGAIYNTARSMTDMVRNRRPDAIGNNASLCLIINDAGERFVGVSGVTVKDDSVTDVRSEDNAIVSMIISNHVNAVQMIVMSFADYSVIKPSDEALELLFRVSDSNKECQIVLSQTKAVSAQNINDQPEQEESQGYNFADFSNSSSFDFDGFSNGSAELGAPAEFVDSVNHDVNNPFYEAPSANDSNQGGAGFLQPAPDENSQQSRNLYQQPANQNGNFPNQGMYSQQMQPNGYPYPQQQGGAMGNPYGQPANPYGQPVNPYGQPVQSVGYGNPNPYYQQPNQSMPYGQYPQQGMGQSVQLGQYPHGSYYGAASSRYQQSRQLQQQSSVMISGQLSGGKSSAFRKRLNSFIDDSDQQAQENTAQSVSNPAQPENQDKNVGANVNAPSIDEMMKQAKDKKKVAKVNADFKRRMKF